MNDDYILPFLFGGSLVLTLFGFYVTIYIVLQKNRQRKHQAEKAEIRHHYESSLLQTKLEVQEQTFYQVSQEIHDNVNQTLGSIKYNLILMDKLVESADYKTLIYDSKKDLDKAIGDLRNISHTLNSEHLHHIGLEESIRKELKYRGSFNDFKYEFKIAGGKSDLSAEKELLIFRIVQEAMTNIIKHAKATTVNIMLNYKPQTFELVIADNGVGFDASDNLLKKGIGIISMNQRAKLMNGVISVNSYKTLGTKITLTLTSPYERPISRSIPDSDS